MICTSSAVWHIKLGHKVFDMWPMNASDPSFWFACNHIELIILLSSVYILLQLGPFISYRLWFSVQPISSWAARYNFVFVQLRCIVRWQRLYTISKGHHGLLKHRQRKLLLIWSNGAERWGWTSKTQRQPFQRSFYVKVVCTQVCLHNCTLPLILLVFVE